MSVVLKSVARTIDHETHALRYGRALVLSLLSAFDPLS